MDAAGSGDAAEFAIKKSTQFAPKIKVMHRAKTKACPSILTGLRIFLG
jgi:hypothetical protein